ncbi:MAG TPA: type II secretion system protein, partial [Thermotogota bacterium]|nr:type II secretion system protein [Thermotogota bacterium]
MKPWKLCKRKGFTFVETMFVLAIIGIVAGISLPVVVEAVKDLDTQSLLDSAVYSLRQFFVDVRSASIMNPKVYCFNNDSSKQLSFSV